MSNITGKKIAILTEEGFEQIELTSPKEVLEAAGANVSIVSPKQGSIKAWNHTDWGIEVEVNKDIESVKADEFDALVLPGGVLNPDKLRMNKTAVQFCADFLQSGKPVAAICHGPQTLIETGLLKGKTLTSYPALETDLKNAGANWEDKEVAEDGNLITSRKPDDLPAFNKAIIKALEN